MSTQPSSLTIGHLELSVVDAGRFRLDGGAMFGVVPKTLWSRQIPADEKNRIPMAMRCLLVRSKRTGKVYLIDNGAGTKFSEKMTDIYALDHPKGGLTASLKNCGVRTEDVTDIVFTHLHFDHCGGTTEYDAEENLREVFPNAVYHVNRRHWDAAIRPNAREKASFLNENIQPLKNSGRLNLVDDYHLFEDGFETVPMNGHTAGQQLPVFSCKTSTVAYAADLIPTFAHVSLPWVMGYDMFPNQTLQEKESFLTNAADKNWFLFLEHDADHEVITVEKKNGKFSVKEFLNLTDIS